MYFSYRSLPYGDISDSKASHACLTAFTFQRHLTSWISSTQYLQISSYLTGNTLRLEWKDKLDTHFKEILVIYPENRMKRINTTTN
jgi:hypothetical protein